MILETGLDLVEQLSPMIWSSFMAAQASPGSAVSDDVHFTSTSSGGTTNIYYKIYGQKKKTNIFLSVIGPAQISFLSVLPILCRDVFPSKHRHIQPVKG